MMTYCPNNNEKSCYYLLSLLDSTCEEHGLYIGLDHERKEAAERYRATLKATTTEGSTQTGAPPTPPPPPPSRSYAEAATQATPPAPIQRDPRPSRSRRIPKARARAR